MVEGGGGGGGSTYSLYSETFQYFLNNVSPYLLLISLFVLFSGLEGDTLFGQLLGCPLLSTLVINNLS